MSPERWARVQELVLAALELEEGDRVHLLESECGDDSGLREAVESLLRVDDLDATFFLDNPPTAAPEPEASPSPKRVSHFEILEVLGQGGMGVVYKARDVDLDRPVALKFISPFLTADEQARKRLIVEAKATSALDHPNICTVHEIGETNEEAGSRLYIAMAFYEGETLEDRIARGPIPFKDAADIIGQAAEGLIRAHEAGVIHRDIKPANIFITKRGLVKILDFGISKMAGMTMTRTSGTVGTLAYMSPEQMQGNPVDQRTDVWSLGAVFYEMLTGMRPFEGDYEAALIYSLLNRDPVAPSDVIQNLPVEINVITHNALAKEVDGRYASVSEMAKDIQRVAAGRTPTATIDTPKTPIHIRLSRPVLWATALVAAIAVAAVAMLAPFSSTAPSVDGVPKIAFFPFAVRGSAELQRSGDQVALLLSRLLSDGYLATSVDYNRVTTEAGDQPNTNPSQAGAITSRLGGSQFVLGSIAEAGGEILVDVSLYSLNGALVDRARAAVPDPTDIPSVIDTLALQLSPNWAPDHIDVELAHKTTTSYEALDELVRYRQIRHGVPDPLHSLGRQHLDRALELDPDFAYIHYVRRDKEKLRRSMYRLPEKERLLAEFIVEDLTFEQKKRKYHALVNGWPSDPEMWLEYAGFLLGHAPYHGEWPSDATPMLERVLELDPQNTDALELRYNVAMVDEDIALMDSLTNRYCAVAASTFICTRLQIITAGADGDTVAFERVLQELGEDARQGGWTPVPYAQAGNRLIGKVKRFEMGRRVWEAVLDGPAITEDWIISASGAIGESYMAEGLVRNGTQISLDLADRAGWSLTGLVTGGFCSYFDYPESFWVDMHGRIARWDTAVARHEFSSWDPYAGDYEELAIYLEGLVAYKLDDDLGVDSAIEKLNAIGDRKGRASLAFSMAQTLVAFRAYRDARLDEAVAALDIADRSYDRSDIAYWSPVSDRVLSRCLRAEMLFAGDRYLEAIPWYLSLNDYETPGIAGISFIGASYDKIAKSYDALGDTKNALKYYERLVRVWANADPELQPYVENARSRVQAILEEHLHEPAS